jgi:hypothetical protein
MRYRDQHRNTREQAVTRELKKLELRQARQLGSPHHRVITAYPPAGRTRS